MQRVKRGERICKMLQKTNRNPVKQTQSLDNQSEAALMVGFWKMQWFAQWHKPHIGSKAQAYVGLNNISSLVNVMNRLK